MNPQVCGQCGQRLGVNVAACAACWAARNPRPQNVPPQAARSHSPPQPADPPPSPPPPKPDSDGWSPHSGELPANSAFRVLKIIASVIGIAGVLVALFLIAYNALR